MKLDDAAAEYVEALHNLQGSNPDLMIASYATHGGETRRYESIITPEVAATVLAHFRDTLRMAGQGRYRELTL